MSQKLDLIKNIAHLNLSAMDYLENKTTENHQKLEFEAHMFWSFVQSFLKPVQNENNLQDAGTECADTCPNRAKVAA